MGDRYHCAECSALTNWSLKCNSCMERLRAYIKDLEKQYDQRGIQIENLQATINILRGSERICHSCGIMIKDIDDTYHISGPRGTSMDMCKDCYDKLTLLKST